MPQDNTNPNILYVVVRNREKTLFIGEVEAVSSRNDRGPFDILPQHTNFITMIHHSLVVKAQGKSDLVIKVDGEAVLKTEKNLVQVFLGVSAPTSAPVARPGAPAPAKA